VNEEQIVAAIARSFTFIWPEALLVLGACVLFLGGTWANARNLWGATALITLGLAAVALVFGPTSNELDRADLYASPLVYDKLAVYIKVLALVSGAVLVLFSWNEVADASAAEYHACLLLIVAGMGLTGMANELVILFLALELISIPTYVLLYLARHDRPAQEAAMKYFLLSVFSSALLLFGFSYLYGLVGTTNLPALTSALAETMPSALPGLALVALVMIVAGLGFRITAVPFHCRVIGIRPQAGRFHRVAPGARLYPPGRIGPCPGGRRVDGSERSNSRRPVADSFVDPRRGDDDPGQYPGPVAG
jgi:NADH-quinone oxidoreductase subunit N